MSDVKKFSLDEVLAEETTGREYTEVPAYGGIVTLGSVSSADVLEWIEVNESDAQAKKMAGLRFLAKSICDPVTKASVTGKEAIEATVQKLLKKNVRDNNKLIAAAFDLNEMVARPKGVAANPFGKTSSGVSPTDSPSS
jgi:hypothetical protein